MSETEYNICLDYLVLISLCPWYSGRRHYQTLEKPGAENITVCENQGK